MRSTWPARTPAPPNPDPLLTLPEVAARLRCSKRTLQRWVKCGVLPRPIRPSSGKCFWRESDIRQFIGALTEAARAEAARS